MLNYCLAPSQFIVKHLFVLSKDKWILANSSAM